MRAGGIRRGAQALAPGRSPAAARRVADDRRPQPGDRPAAPRVAQAALLAEVGDRRELGDAKRWTGYDAEREHRGRPAAADLHLLPPGAPARGAGRADAAHARGADHRRDRARLPRPRADDGQAARPGQAQDRATRGSRIGCRRRTCCPSDRPACSRSCTCCSTRATPRPAGADLVRANLCATRRSGWLALLTRADARRARGPRAARADAPA